MKNIVPPRSELRKQDLSRERQRLVDLCQRLWFGSVRNLPIRSSDPVLDPLPRTVRRRKNTCVGATRAHSSEDYSLKQEWVAFFADLDLIKDGIILEIEVANGLPLIHEYDDVITV